LPPLCALTRRTQGFRRAGGCQGTTLRVRGVRGVRGPLRCPIFIRQRRPPKPYLAQRRCPFPHLHRCPERTTPRRPSATPGNCMPSGAFTTPTSWGCVRRPAAEASGWNQCFGSIRVHWSHVTTSTPYLIFYAHEGNRELNMIPREGTSVPADSLFFRPPPRGPPPPQLPFAEGI